MFIIGVSIYTNNYFAEQKASEDNPIGMCRKLPLHNYIVPHYLKKSHLVKETAYVSDDFGASDKFLSHVVIEDQV